MTAFRWRGWGAARACSDGMLKGLGRRSCLRQSRLLATSDVGIGGRGMAIDVTLPNASYADAARQGSPQFETAAALVAVADGTALGDGGVFLCITGGTGGRRGRRRTGRDRSRAGSVKSGGRRGNAAGKRPCNVRVCSGGGGGAGAGIGAAGGDSTLGFNTPWCR